MDPYGCVIDTGCTKTVAGKVWMDAYMKTQETGIRTGKENEKFRFGSSDTYKSETYYEIKIEANELKEKIRVSVIDANIPLLLGLEYQTRWGMIIDSGTEEIYVRKSGDRFKKDKRLNMWTLPIQKKERPRKITKHSADKHKKHGKAVITNNNASKIKDKEKAIPSTRDKITTIPQKEEEEKLKKDSESDMIKNE